jgi:alpha-tubulin suppressor-like RCC1 family protein
VQLGTETNWAVVSLGVDNTYAVKTDGTLWSWGLNNVGQLGLNLATTAHRSSPVQVGTLNTWLDVSAGYSFTMAIRNDGTLWGWGINTNTQIGDGTNISRSSPVQIGTLNTWVSASSGNANSVLLQNNGYALTTGNGVHPGYDTGFLLNRSSPVQIGTQSNWSNASVGFHSAAVRTDGTLWTWGLNTSGQLGIGVATNRSSAVQVGTLNNWATAYAIGTKTYAIKTDGTLWAWGSNDNGELGQNNFGVSTYRSSPVQIGTRTWSNVARGTASNALHVVAVRTDGTIWSWGSGNSGRLGLDDNISRSSPVQIGTRPDWASATIGASNTMLVRSDGTLWGLGINIPNQQLGVFQRNNISSPVQVGTLSNWVSASLATNYSVILQNNGDAYTNGIYPNDFSEISINRSSPVQLGTLSNWADADCGYLASFAVKTDGTLWSWGYNASGELGLGYTGTISSPVQVGTLNNWAKVVGGFGTAYAIKTDGTIWSWGSNTYGQLGLGDAVNKSSPVQIGTRTWSSLASGVNGLATHMMAIRSDGTLWSWGSNDIGGELGLNLPGFQYRSSPVQIGTRSDWVSATVGFGTSMAIRSDGTLWAWGTNATARLGLGDTVSRSSPVQVGTLSNWVSASLGSANSVLLQNNGYALTTGNTAPGYDVNAYNINRSTPAQIGADTDWVRVTAGHINFSAGGNQIIAQKSDGTLWTWGSNTAGNLGDGTLVGKSSPVQIGNDTTWVDFGAQLHFVGIKQY